MERFAETGLEVGRQEFSYDIRPAFRALRLLLSKTAILVAAAGLAISANAVLSLALILAALASGAVFLTWAPWLEGFYRSDGPTKTANVIARRRATTPRMTLVLLAHHDSKSQNLILPVRAGLTLVAIGGTLALCVVSGITVFGDEPVPPTLALSLSGVAALSLLGLATLRSGNRSPGGTDNAGSVGILLELARKLPAVLPEDVDLVFLSPGAEEDHMVGAMRWLDAEADRLSPPVYALNIDGAGIPGRVALLERYGLGRWFSRELSAVTREAAARLGIRLRGVFIPPALGVDAIPFAHRGIDCVTFASGSLSKAVLAVHSAGDVAENLDRESLAEVAALVAATAQEVVLRRGP